ncbi:hypothetical protein AAGS39_14250 [Flavobacterium sp. CGRL2]
MFNIKWKILTLHLPATKKNNFRQTVLGAKYLIYDPYKNKREVNIYSYKANHSFNWRELIPAVSIFAGANFVGADNPYYFSPDGAISPKVSLITQNLFGGGKWVFVTNIIADYIGTDYPSYGYVLTLTHGFNEKWSGFVENQGYKSDFYSDAIVRGGAAYLLSPNMQVDASISTNFKNTPSVLYGGVGISWRYDGWYKDKQALNKAQEKAKKNPENEKKCGLPRKKKEDVKLNTNKIITQLTKRDSQYHLNDYN